MNTLMPSLLPFLALIILSTDVAAGPARFDCTVTSVHAISEQGEVVTDTDHLKKQVGSKFSVDRRTGAIRGGYFINKEYSKETRVINDPADNSYYAVTTSHGPVVMVGYLYIGNHRKSARKPFAYTSSGEYIYYGYCE